MYRKHWQKPAKWVTMVNAVSLRSMIISVLDTDGSLRYRPKLNLKGYEEMVQQYCRSSSYAQLGGSDARHC
jgi:hypothetical protein